MEPGAPEVAERDLVRRAQHLDGDQRAVPRRLVHRPELALAHLRARGAMSAAVAARCRTVCGPARAQERMLARDALADGRHA